MDEIRVLQLGDTDWNTIYTLADNVELTYVQEFTEKPEESYDVVFLDRTPSEDEILILQHVIKAYTLFVTERVELKGRVRWLYDCRCGQLLDTADVQDFLNRELRFYYAKPYGEKYDLKNLTLSGDFLGYVKWNGNHDVTLRGDFGKELKQIAFWRNYIPLFQNQVLDLWLEYKKDPGVSISLVIIQMAAGSLSQVINQWEFSEEDLEQIVRIEGNMGEGPIFASIRAKGSGELQIIALHDRYSRGTHGYFLPGGERFVTSEREEIFAYFEPGDMKPPLNVYFSGYKTAEGFEGYNLMRSMGCPFLLISEARLEGGSFYMGSDEYEKQLTDVIRKYMYALGFSSEQVILSGLSMGTYGALYYGCDILPHALLLGKPLASIGNVATNEKRFRPGGFPTSLDVLMYTCGDTDPSAVDQLNRRFWDKFDASDWGNSKFIISYMIEDDYDSDAYQKLLAHLQSDGVQVYGKGIHGRHNDNTGAIVSWFAGQYKKILHEDFGREVER